MSLFKNFFDEVRQRVDITSVIGDNIQLSKKGGEYLGLCPFHNEKTPSFSVNARKGFYYCFGCSTSGDVIKFLSQISGVSYKQAAFQLANQNNIPLPEITPEKKAEHTEKEKVQEVLEVVNQFFKSQLNDKVLNYLTKRDITSQMIENFSIGFAPQYGKLFEYLKQKNIPLLLAVKAGLFTKDDNGNLYEIFRKRIIFPIKDVYGKVIAFGGRSLNNDSPKYINSPETLLFKKSENLFAEDLAISNAYKKKQIIVVEGYLDAIALHIAGFNETVASLGTALTEAHLHKLWRLVDEIVICFDNDKAGVQATIRVADMVLPLVDTKRTIKVVFLPKGSDPANLLLEKGKNYLQNVILKKTTLAEAIWSITLSKFDISCVEQRAKLENTLKNYTNKIDNLIIKKHYNRFFKQKCWSLYVNKYKKITTLPSIDIEKLDSISYVERCIITFLIKYPHVLKEEMVIENFVSINFFDNNLEIFKNWILDHIKTSEYDHLKLVKAIENSSCKTLYQIFENFESLMNSLIGKKQNIMNMWQILLRRYYLILLQYEFDEYLKKQDVEQQQTLFYKEEIYKLESELKFFS